MRFTWTARSRRLLFVLVMLAVLTFPLVATQVTRARLERSGVDVSATVVQAVADDGRYLVAFRLPADVDPDRRAYSAEVDRAAYDEARASGKITVRVLEDRPQTHRVEGQVDSRAPYVYTALAGVLVLVVGLWWVKVGRRRPTVRMRAHADLSPAGSDDPRLLSRGAGDVYEAVGTVVAADDAEVVVDIGERKVVVLLDGYRNPASVGDPVRARGPLVG